MSASARRGVVLDWLVETARGDDVVTAAALVGSLARREADAWSDVDLALRLQPGVDPLAAAAAWTDAMAGRFGVADHLDVWAGPALYRVFLLPESLQVDLSFWPHDRFASTGGAFEVLFGAAAEEAPEPSPTVGVGPVVGWAWLYALHVRSALGRGRVWQAVLMLNGLRDQLIHLACARHGLPVEQGRGVDLLPQPVRDALERTMPVVLHVHTVAGCFLTALDLLAKEVELVDPARAARLAGPLAAVGRSTFPE